MLNQPAEGRQLLERLHNSLKFCFLIVTFEDGCTDIDHHLPSDKGC